MPPLAIASSLSWAYLAVQKYRTPLTGRLAGLEQESRLPLALYTSAAALIPCIVPFTLTVMKKVNSRLHAKADSNAAEAKGADGEVDEMLEKWVVLNWTRAGIAAVGAACGAVAVVRTMGAM